MMVALSSAFAAHSHNPKLIILTQTVRIEMCLETSGHKSSIPLAFVCVIIAALSMACFSASDTAVMFAFISLTKCG